MRFAALLVLVACALGACGGGDDAPGASAGPSTATAAPVVRVVTTTTQLTDFATVIGGERIEVYGVVRPNVDPHDYEPTPADLEAVRHADVIVRNGVGLEHWFDDVVDSSGTDGTVVDASQGIAIRGGAADGHEGGDAPADEADEHDEGDPHIWFDPANAEQMVRTLAAALDGRRPVRCRDLRGEPRRLRRRAPRPRHVDRPADRHAHQHEAGHEPRRLRLLRRPVRPRLRGLGHPELRHHRRALGRRAPRTSSTTSARRA